MEAGMRSLALGAAAGLTVVSAYAWGSSQGDGVPDAAAAGALQPAAAVEGGEGARTIAMRGTGESTGVPDQLTFRLSVRGEADDVSTALDDAGASMRRVLSALRRAEVRPRDVQTTGLSVRHDYDYSRWGPTVLTGYVATQSVAVLVRDLRDSGAAITAATRAGGNAVRVSGVGLRIGERDGLLAEARDVAVAQARAKAEQYAAATGQTLGPVRSVREVRARGGAPVSLSYGRVVADAAAAVPIRAGTEELRVTVAVVWELE